MAVADHASLRVLRAAALQAQGRTGEAAQAFDAALTMPHLTQHEQQSYRIIAADAALAAMRANRYGAGAAIIGEVTADQPGRVIMRTEIGAETLLPPPGGELLPRICEPYVTTKARGTGLGLPIVKKIIDEHQGSIEISNAANGSCFQTKVTTTPRQSSRLMALSGSSRPSDISELLSMPLLARKVRINCAATTNGMNNGQR